MANVQGAELWQAVDDYIEDHLLPIDEVLEGALAASEKAGLPAINVAPTQGKLLQLLARMSGARRILEVGTLGGYSTIWLARALPEDGRLVTLEYAPAHAEVARANIEAAGLSDRVELRVGAALDTLAALVEEGTEPFDFIFIDADKPNNANYLTFALQLSRVGTVIVADNVVRRGAVLDAQSKDPSVQGTRDTFAWLAAQPRVSSTALQTVGMKGHDGLAIALVVA